LCKRWCRRQQKVSVSSFIVVLLTVVQVCAARVQAVVHCHPRRIAGGLSPVSRPEAADRY
jgi:hypothetical protein